MNDPASTATATDFFVKIADMQLSFTTDASGTVTGLLVHMSGRNEDTGQKYRYNEVGQKVR